LFTSIKTEWPMYYLAKELQEWNEYMNTSKTIKDALLELRAKEAFYVKKAEEVRALIQGLESFGRNGDEQNKEVLVINGQEFINAGIAEAAATMIRRAKRPMHVSEIVKGLEAGGYHFKAEKPENSVAPVLYQAAGSGSHGIVKMPKNTYTLKEIEDRTVSS
jgi:hypothetical protein